MQKMRMIDILDKIANRKLDSGTRIKCNGKTYIFGFLNYKAGIYEEGMPLTEETNFFSRISDVCSLDCEVEILGKPIEKINTLYGISEPGVGWENEEILFNYTIELRDKVNELVGKIEKIEAGE